MASAADTSAADTSASDTSAGMTSADMAANASSLFESTCLLVEAYIKANINQYIQPTFHDTVLKEVAELLALTFQDCSNDEIEYTEIAEQALAVFYRHISPPRSNGNTFIRRKPNINKMRKKIEFLQAVPQPEQRTPEWYAFRYQHLTASNIWKTFISDSTRNQLIFEKCQPLNADSFSRPPSLTSPMHWGQKYEPLSVMVYETEYATGVSDFGCIPHEKVEFLAASPDGINTLATSNRYGRMLEIKNIVNREINGNPKMEYWVQMQLQMEVCDLNECDFLETRFVEYADLEAFQSDETPCKYRGLILMFMKSSGHPVYEYAPLALAVADSGPWQEAMMEKHKDLMWLKNIYWKLDQLSCVLVLRNKLWFAKAALPQLKAIWATIEEEKKSGFAHRGPKKSTAVRVRKMNANGSDYDTNIEMTAKCFITIET